VEEVGKGKNELLLQRFGFKLTECEKERKKEGIEGSVPDLVSHRLFRPFCQLCVCVYISLSSLFISFV